jgi:hypothetical protein
VDHLHTVRFPILASLNAVNVLGAAALAASNVLEYQNFLGFTLGFYFVVVTIMGSLVCYALWKGKPWSYKALIIYFLLGLPLAVLYAYELRDELASYMVALFFLFYVFVAGLIVYYVYDETRSVL